MIDTDKYEGHTPANQWRVLQYCEESLGVFFLAGTTNPNQMYEEECLHCGPQRDGLSQQVFDGRMSEEEVVKLCERDSANQTLMQDAPLLLAEVKRLERDNAMLENKLQFTKDLFGRSMEKQTEIKESLLAEIKRLREKLEVDKEMIE
tara:strand:+ start:4499 stop:4942 length:444 start_codon:yes stop_codon:yes gene_type:complete